MSFLVVAGPRNKAKELESQKQFYLKGIDSAVLSKLKCGGCESQLLSTDSLAKLDVAVEGVLRRIERAVNEADKDAKIDKSPSDVPLAFDGEERPFTVKVNSGKWRSTTDYLREFEWNKFGKDSVQETAQEIQKAVEAMDTKFRTQVQSYTDQKNEWFLVQPPDAAGPFSFATKDLVDVLVPDTVTEKNASKPDAGDDFIYTKNMTTIVVVVPSGADDAFVAWHDGCVEEEKVIPSSAKKLKAVGTDKDGASLYRVLVMRSGQTAFLKACREAGWVTSDFVYKGKTGYQKLVENRAEFEKTFKTSHQELLNAGLEYWSDVFQSWAHLKVLRAAVEGNLRYGEIPAFALVSMPAESAAFRKQLANILGTDKERLMEDAEVDDYFPYVSVALQP